MAPIDAPRPGSAVPLLSPSHSTSCVSFVMEARYTSPMGSIPFTAHSRITTWRCCGLKITYFLACWMERASSWRQRPPKINPASDEKERKTYMTMSVSVYLWVANKTSVVVFFPPHTKISVLLMRFSRGGNVEGIVWKQKHGWTWGTRLCFLFTWGLKSVQFIYMKFKYENKAKLSFHDLR